MKFTVFEGKGDPMECAEEQRWLECAMKLIERVFERRMRK